MERTILNDIFDDPFLEEYKKATSKPKTTEKDRDVISFLEIINWMENHDGNLPTVNRNSIIERRLATRLESIQNSVERIKKLKPYVKLDILPDVSLSINDILEDDFLEEAQPEESLFDISRYKTTIAARDKRKHRSREKADNFSKYKYLFQQVHEELDNGQRKIVKPDSENNIEKGKFYIDNGVMFYIAAKGEFFQDKNGFRNAELHVVYENGTENKNALLRSIASSLFDTTRNGRMITERIDDVMADKFGNINISSEKHFTNVNESEKLYNHEPSWSKKVKEKDSNTSDDITTGYIYVVRSLSKDPQISQMDNMYKVGFTTQKVEKRIASAQREAAYLFAPVEIIVTWEVRNIDPHKLEIALHHYFAGNILDIEITGANGRPYFPKEWILASLDAIKRAVNDIIERVKSLE